MRGLSLDFKMTGANRILVLFVSFGLVAGAVPHTPVGAADELPVTGEYYPGLAPEIDVLLEEFVDEHDLPGLSVAASKDGRLVLSLARGYANTTDKTPLGPDDQMLLGSTTKALVTGPTMIEALDGTSAATTAVYGKFGILGTDFDEDIKIGAEANPDTPIEWYYDITVQHLLDHTAGFSGASTTGAAKLFGVSKDDVTYEQIHRHFLQTAGLDHKPGSELVYDNHHFGVMKLLIEALTDVDQVDFTVSDVLGPWGLSPEIEAVSDTYHPWTADNHMYNDDGEPVPYTPDYSQKEWFTAGGYRGSARDVVELANRLAETYTPIQVSQNGFWNKNVTMGMNWGDSDTDYVDHNGIVDGGSSWVFMSVDEIFVSIQTNIWNTAALLDMPELYEKIAKLLRETKIPTHYDLWTGCTLLQFQSGYASMVFSGVESDDYQCLSDALVGADYRPRWIDASNNGLDAFFNVVFEPDDGVATQPFHGLSGSEYQELNDKLVDDGYRPAQVDSYLSPTKGVLYAGYYETGSVEGIASYHGLSEAEHEAQTTLLGALDYSPTSLSVVRSSTGHRYTAIFEKGLPGAVYVETDLTNEQYQALFAQQGYKGLHPVYLNGWNNSSVDPRLVVIFRSIPDDPPLAYHHVDVDVYQQLFNDATTQGFATDVVTAYTTEDKILYATLLHTAD